MGKAGFSVSKLMEDLWMIQSYRELRCPPYLTTSLKLSSARYNFICFILDLDIIYSNSIYSYKYYIWKLKFIFKEERRVFVVFKIWDERQKGDISMLTLLIQISKTGQILTKSRRGWHETWNKQRQYISIYRLGLLLKLNDKRERRERDQSPVLQMTTWYKLFRIGRATNCNGTFSPL